MNRHPVSDLGLRLGHARARRMLAAGFAGALASLFVPAAAIACSVCIGASDADTALAYRAMTAFMTFMPLSIVGGVIFWIWRRYKTLDEQEALLAASVHVPPIDAER